MTDKKIEAVSEEGKDDSARRAFLKRAAAVGVATPATVALILSAGAKPANALQVSPE